MMMSKLSPWILGSAALASALAVCPRALAFGGLWTSASSASSANGAIKQSSERIILVDNPDSTVTAIVQVEYEGPSEEFVWIIPVPGKPTVGVSSSRVFERLDAATAPQYWVEESIEGACSREAEPDAGSSSNEPVDPTSVVTVDRGSVGPYDYVTIAVDSGAADAAAVATEWLAANGYASTSLANELLGSYLKEGSNLLAFKLKQGTDAGAIRPVVLRYDSELPTIPIRLTAASASDDMDIQVWVVGPSQAVPDNYESLVINDARIDWQSARKFQVGTLPSGGVGPFGEYVSKPNNYAAVITAAANEADGRGFVTELAGPASQFRDKVWSPADQETFNTISTQSYTAGIDALLTASSNYSGWDGWNEVVRGAVTLPDGVTLDQLVLDPEPYRGVVEVDTTRFFQLLEEHVIQPIADTAALLYNAPYLTRLYTTMSASEMTSDPVFNFNFDLAQVSSVHLANQHVECSSELGRDEAPWRMQLPQGSIVAGEGSGWPVTGDSTPANLKVVKLSTEGSGKVVQDNTEQIREGFDTTSSGTVLRPPQIGLLIGATQTVTPPPENREMTAPAMRSDTGCSISNTGGAREVSTLTLGAFLASGIVAFRRRRRPSHGAGERSGHA
ncbi:MAG TPA: DUF2330 domain-containing protein [Polyangiales bacterium]|nr:DUF2330 domain-containing protein [Polyangiales bacterium]